MTIDDARIEVTKEKSETSHNAVDESRRIFFGCRKTMLLS